jgi:alpha-D-glucose phosphate-specific phosphoglucomutase
MPTQIKFGTSGWRGIIAEDFTVANVQRAVSGIARYVTAKNAANPRLIVGRDPRFMGETFVSIAAEILSSQGIQPLVISEPAPTPAISFEVTRSKADGAINFTASHNPPEYNGIKFSTADGAPALPEVTRAIEQAIAEADAGALQGREPKSTVAPQQIEVRTHYLERLKEIVDLSVIKKAGLKIVFDPFWGAGRGYSDAILREAGIDVAVVHDTRDVLFGGHAPEPDDHLLGDCKAKMSETAAQIGIATDGDADRFGIVDSDGTFIQPNYIIALLFDYLVESRGWRNGVAKSVATTNLINALAEVHKIELHETPVGFKYIGELIKQDKIAIGGEESAGMSIRHHVPEKDGVIAGLLCCEMVGARRQSLSELLRRLFNQVGSFYPVRENFRLTTEMKEKFTRKVVADPEEFYGRKIKKVLRTDGLKLVLGDGSWVCYRMSGTEPVVRVYTEARSRSDSTTLTQAAKQWVMA